MPSCRCHFVLFGLLWIVSQTVSTPPPAYAQGTGELSITHHAPNYQTWTEPYPGAVAPWRVIISGPGGTLPRGSLNKSDVEISGARLGRTAWDGKYYLSVTPTGNKVTVAIAEGKIRLADGSLNKAISYTFGTPSETRTKGDSSTTAALSIVHEAPDYDLWAKHLPGKTPTWRVIISGPEGNLPRDSISQSDVNMSGGQYERFGWDNKYYLSIIPTSNKVTLTIPRGRVELGGNVVNAAITYSFPTPPPPGTEGAGDPVDPAPGEVQLTEIKELKITHETPDFAKWDRFFPGQTPTWRVVVSGPGNKLPQDALSQSDINISGGQIKWAGWDLNYYIDILPTGDLVTLSIPQGRANLGERVVNAAIAYTFTITTPPIVELPPEEPQSRNIGREISGDMDIYRKDDNGQYQKIHSGDLTVAVNEDGFLISSDGQIIDDKKRGVVIIPASDISTGDDQSLSPADIIVVGENGLRHASEKRAEEFQSQRAGSGASPTLASSPSRRSRINRNDPYGLAARLRSLPVESEEAGYIRRLMQQLDNYGEKEFDMLDERREQR